MNIEENNTLVMTIRDMGGDELHAYTTVSTMMTLVMQCCEDWDVSLVDVMKDIGDVELVDALAGSQLQ